MSEQPSIAVVGCGGWGANHVRTWASLGALRLVCDVDEARIRGLSLPSIVETTTSFASILDRADIDGIVIATPAPTHPQLVEAALRAGKDVLVEKPLALTVDVGRRLVALAEDCERILAVGHVLEYHPAILALRDFVASGDLGRIQYVYSNRLNLGRIRSEENVLWSFAPHDVAIILRLLGLPPIDIACHGGEYLSRGVADTTLTSMRFPSEVRAHIFVSWLHPVKEHRFVVVGERQMAVFDDSLPWPEKLSLYPHRVDWMDGTAPVATRAEAVRVDLEQVEPLRAECEHFLRCITTRERPLTDGQSALAVLEVLEVAQRSLERGGATLSLDRAEGYYAHPTAVIDADTRIGDKTRIWHYTHVMSGSSIGSDCVLGQNVYVGRGVTIGNTVKIQNNVSVYEGVTLEDGVFCGPSTVFTNVINPRSEIQRMSELRPTVVRQGASLGANSTIVCGVTIGRYALIGAGAVVTRDVPDHALVTGSPARARGWVCICGVKLGHSNGIGRCSDCGRAYEVTDAGIVESNESEARL